MGWRHGRGAWRLWAAALALAFLAAAACTINPASGRPQLALLSEPQEIALGRGYDRRLQALLGVYPDAALQAYVEQVGRRLAAGSERPDLAWTFRVVDDAAVNAFSLPGGHVYVTRGLLTYLTSEAQLAAVLGHEIGHVTARHAVTRLSQARIAGLGVRAGSLLGAAVGRSAARGLEVLFLRHSRDDERQADDLGLRYLVAQGYDPREMPAVFEVLRRTAPARDGERIPGWLATHPSVDERIRTIRGEVDRLGDLAGRRVGREAYLRAIDGVVFGRNPRQGYFLGSAFVQPALAVRIDFPAGWKSVNARSSTESVAPGQDAVLVLSLSGETSWRKAAREFFLHRGSESGETLAMEIHGQPGVVRTFGLAGTDAGELRGVAAFVEYGGRVHQILGVTQEKDWAAYRGELISAVESFRPETDRARLDVQPRRLEIVALPVAMTLEDASRRYPSAVDLETLAVINQREAVILLEAGELIKRVVDGGMPAGATLGPGRR